jgi:ATP-dependent helicase/nuclease subunit A
MVAHLPPLATPQAPGSAVDQTSRRDSEARRLGRAVHRTLQWHGVCSAAAADLQAHAAAAAREFELAGDIARRVFEIASVMLGSPQLAQFFDPQRVLWAADEIEVSHAGEVLRIDRLVRIGPVEAPAWWVLDYKLDANPIGDPVYRAQLARYRDAVRHLAGAMPVHAAFATSDGELHELN